MRNTEDTRDVSRLDRIFGSMDRRGWQPDRVVRLHAAIAYARAREWSKAIAWFEPAVRRGGGHEAFLHLPVLSMTFCEKLHVPEAP